ncbi:hypothetical protein EIP86_004938 [Pleurotus ostreatoroseus]|nr:hypothetical protein EIP86_004938 [Pleurotus ostreatoroseus]
MSAIKNGSQKWRDELFRFYNRWIFGNPKGLPGEANAAAGIPEDFVSGADELRQFRKERDKREAAAAKIAAKKREAASAAAKANTREHEAAAAMQQLARQQPLGRRSPMQALQQDDIAGSPEQEVRPYGAQHTRYSTPRDRSTSRVRASDGASSTTSRTRKSATQSQRDWQDSQATPRSGRTTRRLAAPRRIDSPPANAPPTPGPSRPRPEAHHDLRRPQEQFSYGDFLNRSRDSSPRRPASRRSSPMDLNTVPTPRRPGESESQYRRRVVQNMNGDD